MIETHKMGKYKTYYHNLMKFDFHKNLIKLKEGDTPWYLHIRHTIVYLGDTFYISKKGVILTY